MGLFSEGFLYIFPGCVGMVVSVVWVVWVIDEGLRNVTESLWRYGISLLDVTPDFGRLDSRAQEICSWLRDHPGVCSFVAIDDMDILLGASDASVNLLKHKFVRTSKLLGMTAEDAHLAVQILRGTRVVDSDEGQTDLPAS